MSQLFLYYIRYVSIELKHIEATKQKTFREEALADVRQNNFHMTLRQLYNKFRLLQTIAIRLEAIAIGLEAIASGSFGRRYSPFLYPIAPEYPQHVHFPPPKG